MSRIVQTQVLDSYPNKQCHSIILFSNTTAVHFGNGKFTDMLTPALDLTHLAWQKLKTTKDKYNNH